MRAAIGARIPTDGSSTVLRPLMHRIKRAALPIALTGLVLLGVAGGLWLRERDTNPPSERTDTPPGLPATTPQADPAPAAPAQRVSDTRLAALGRDGPLIGMADNRPETLSDPRFRATGIKRVRVAVPYDDVALGGERLAIQDAWFGAARAAAIEPVVTFFRSSRGKAILPTPAEFRRAFQLFRARYPWVRLFSTWNEANFTAQPTSRDPERTAAFYRVARDECSGARCFVLACDFRPDGTLRSARWLAAFQRAIGPGPHTWGLSSYVDVNRRSTVLTRDFLAHTKGRVWVNEVGAVHFFGKGLRPSIARQTRVMGFLTTSYPRLSRRIERIYVYHWRAAPGDDLFDSALLDLAGRARPAYYEFVRAIGRPAP